MREARRDSRSVFQTKLQMFGRERVARDDALLHSRSNHDATVRECRARYLCGRQIGELARQLGLYAIDVTRIECDEHGDRVGVVGPQRRRQELIQVRPIVLDGRPADDVLERAMRLACSRRPAGREAMNASSPS